MKRLGSLSLCLMMLVASHVLAQNAPGSGPLTAPPSPPPATMYYQGYVAGPSGGPIANGNYDFTFAMYSSSTGGSPLWQETHPAVEVKNGLFSVVLGQGTPAVPLNLLFDQQYYLGVQLGGGAEFSPRVQLATTPYSFHALRADIVPDFSITSGKLSANGSVPGQVLTANPGGGVSWQTPAAGGDMMKSVYDVNNNNEVDVAELAHTVDDGAITEQKIADGAVTTNKILDNAVGELKIKDDAVSQTKIKATGAGPGRVLTYTGTDMVWQTPAVGGLTLPYSGAGNLGTSLFGLMNNGTGIALDVTGAGNAIYGTSTSATLSGTVGVNLAGGVGVWGQTTSGDAVHAVSATGTAVSATTTSGTAVRGINTTSQDFGMLGLANGGVYGYTNGSSGVHSGVYGYTGPSSGSAAFGVFAENGGGGYALWASNSVATGFGTMCLIQNASNPNAALQVQTYGTGSAAMVNVYNAASTANALYVSTAGSGKAGFFSGNLQCTGTLSKGAGTFMIDHPLDPANKYLYHSFVESPDMMNVYNGNAVLDANGEAVIDLPTYFEALNKDFRYQLTAVGAPGPNLYVARKIAGNTFKIAGGAPGGEVSWQVTGVRKDPYAEQNRVVPEVDKEPANRGLYLHPKEWNQPVEKGIGYQEGLRTASAIQH